MKDVPLMRAMLVWNPLEHGGGAKVVTHPDTDGSGADFMRSVGACFGDPLHRPGNTDDWAMLSDSEQLAQILAFAWQAVVRDGVSTSDMHRALCVIPEFRDAMTPDMLPEETAA